jgi:dipeptide transport system permease protein
VTNNAVTMDTMLTGRLPVIRRRPSVWRRAWQEIRSSAVSLAAFSIIAFFVFVALVSIFWTPHDPLAVNLVDAKLIPPAFMDGGTYRYLLGTDASGRDLLSRLMQGSQLSLIVGFVPVCLSLVLGVPFGLVAGYAGGKVDELIMRVNDVFLAFPSILLALIVVAVLGQGVFNLMIAVGIAHAPTFARVVRGAVMSQVRQDYVQAATSLGARRPRIVIRHIFPNIVNALIVIFTIAFASALLEAAGLSFLGLGVRPPTPEWGSMLADGKEYFMDGWWMILAPGICIFLVVISLNILGDNLRDALDPRAARSE